MECFLLCKHSSFKSSDLFVLETLPIALIAGRQAGATGGTALQEILVKLPHGLAGVALILSWVMTLNSLLRNGTKKK